MQKIKKILRNKLFFVPSLPCPGFWIKSLTESFCSFSEKSFFSSFYIQCGGASQKPKKEEKAVIALQKTKNEEKAVIAGAAHLLSWSVGNEHFVQINGLFVCGSLWRLLTSLSEEVASGEIYKNELPQNRCQALSSTQIEERNNIENEVKKR